MVGVPHFRKCREMENNSVTTKNVSVAVIGCGYWGKNLIRNFSDLGVLAAVCDTNASQLKEMADRFCVPGCATADEMLQFPGINAVVIAAPATEHFALAKKAMLADKDVFVEKPLALHVDEGSELVELARRRGRILMVGHLLIYHPAVREMKRLVSSGSLGKIQYLHSSRLNWGKVRTEENILWSFAPHDISAMLYLLEEEPISISAHGGSYLSRNVADTTLSTFDFASGARAHIFVSWLNPYKEQRLVVVGDRQTVVFDDTKSNSKLVVYPHRIEWVDRLPIAVKAEGKPIQLPDGEPLRAECEHFIECVRDRRAPQTDGGSALVVLRLLRECQSSLENDGYPTRLEKPHNYFAHATAVVDHPVEIGDGTKIWHFSHIMSGATIGANCNLGQNVHVGSGVWIGDNVKLQNNVSVYTGVELENDVFCGPSVVFTNVINPRSHVERKSEYRRTLVRQGASLGANSTIICGCTIGRFAFVAAGAVVTKDVPDYALVIGAPARQVGWICKCGIRLEVHSGKATCPTCHDMFVVAGATLHPGARVVAA